MRQFLQISPLLLVFWACSDINNEIKCFQDPIISEYEDNNGIRVRYMQQNEGQIRLSYYEESEERYSKFVDSPTRIDHGVINYTIPSYISSNLFTDNLWSANNQTCSANDRGVDESGSWVEFECGFIDRSNETTMIRFSSTKGIVAFALLSSDEHDDLSDDKFYLITEKGISSPC